MSDRYLPSDRIEIERLVADRTPEAQRLEFKRGDVLRGDRAAQVVTKAISGLANADGGTVVLGIAAKDSRASTLHPVEKGDCTRDRLEQLINLVRPRVPGLEISQIDIDGIGWVYAISIPASGGTPYQASDHVYYRRHQTHCLPMAHYELEELRRRAMAAGPRVYVDLRPRRSFLVDLVVGNSGDAEASDVTLEIEPSVVWGDRTPQCLLRPLQALRPTQELTYIYGSWPQILGDQPTRPAQVKITVTHKDPVGNSVRASFDFNLEDYRGAQGIRSEAEQLTEVVKEGFKGIKDGLGKIEDQLERLSTIASATGLDLSVTTRRSIARTLGREPVLETFRTDVDYRVFEEVLGVDAAVALRLEQFFRFERRNGKKLADVIGMTPEIENGLAEMFSDVDS